MWSATLRAAARVRSSAKSEEEEEVIPRGAPDTIQDSALGYSQGSNRKASCTVANVSEVGISSSSSSSNGKPRERHETIELKQPKEPLSVALSYNPDDDASSIHDDSERGNTPSSKQAWTKTLVISCRKFGRFCITPFGFLVTVYGLNIVAWGAMLFFLLIGGANQTMCWVQSPPGSGVYVHDCDDLQSPRRIWIEIDSQILTALFCVTAFGLAPWRSRDLWFLTRWRVTGDIKSLRRLAAWHQEWFRLPGSDRLDPVFKYSDYDMTHNCAALPEPINKAPEPPLTGERAKATALWKLDFVVWSMMLNTFMQVVLCYFMWAMNRFDRPNWSTGLFVVLGCLSAAAGGVVQFQESKRIKTVEGVPLNGEQVT